MAAKEWLLDLSRSDLRDDDCEGACSSKVSVHRRRGQDAGRLPYHEIDLSLNRLVWQGCRAVVDIGLRCQDLRVVKLCRNRLSDLAAPSLARLAEACRPLEQLHLSHNRLTDAGAAAVIAAAGRGRREARGPGRPLWLRLEHNHIRRSTAMLEDLWEQRVDFCEARDARQCGPRACKRRAHVHLPYVSQQDPPGGAEGGGPEAAAAAPAKASSAAAEVASAAQAASKRSEGAVAKGARADPAPAGAGRERSRSRSQDRGSGDEEEVPTSLAGSGDEGGSASARRRSPTPPPAAPPAAARAAKKSGTSKRRGCIAAESLGDGEEEPEARPPAAEAPEARRVPSEGREASARKAPSEGREAKAKVRRKEKKRKAKSPARSASRAKAAPEAKTAPAKAAPDEGRRSPAKKRRREEKAAREEGRGSSSKPSQAKAAPEAPAEADAGEVAREEPKGAFAFFRPVKVITKQLDRERTGSSAMAAMLLAGREPADPKALSREKGQKDGAKAVGGLGNILEMQKLVEDERNRLRLWVIRAKQEWEERSHTTGVTNEEEYYVASAGELLGPNKDYRNEGKIGRGVFSSVYRCKSTSSGAEYAVKFIRSNTMMRKAAEKEVEMYRRLAKSGPASDPDAAPFVMFLADKETFQHMGHLCMVFELQRCDLRSALQKYGQGRGLPLQTVAQYSKQVFLALRLLRKLSIIHGDLKPDNLLMSLSKTEIKLCDFGSAMDAAETVSTAYLQPRYYRAPEVMIGNAYGTQIDLWSAGVTLFELATGKILLTGKTNNAMLAQMLEVCGAVPKRMATGGSCSAKHFDAEGNFLRREPGAAAGRPETLPMRRFLQPARPVEGLLRRALQEPPPNADLRIQERLLPRLSELLAGCLRMDPAERFSPEQALSQRFHKKDK